MTKVGYLYHPVFLAHRHPNHVENADRLAAIMGLLLEQNALADLTAVPFTAATQEQLGTVHEPAYVELLKRFSAIGGGMLDPGTYVNGSSYDAAAMAAGAAADAARAVLRGDVPRAFALVRPPGHHAFADHGEGFCLFNNVAFAARCALDEFVLQRVMIVDWDVHHGNGTQDIFYADPRVLYVSTHQMPLYPGTGRAEETGEGAGRGTTLDIPLPPGAGDAAFARVFDEVIVPAARRYRPQLMLVSAGYDAHWRDNLAGWRATLGGLNVSLAGFGRMASTVCGLSDELCEGRVVAVLEGGYDLEVLSHGVYNTLRVFQGESIDDPIGAYTGKEPSIEPLLVKVKRLHGI
jgi:acetoin utilization deacetylase AcuC-like enzyme